MGILSYEGGYCANYKLYYTYYILLIILCHTYLLTYYRSYGHIVLCGSTYFISYMLRLISHHSYLSKTWVGGCLLTYASLTIWDFIRCLRLTSMYGKKASLVCIRCSKAQGGTPQTRKRSNAPLANHKPTNTTKTTNSQFANTQTQHAPTDPNTWVPKHTHRKPNKQQTTNT